MHEITLTAEQLQTVLWLCYREGEFETGNAIEAQIEK
jgi:hypothetical protein